MLVDVAKLKEKVDAEIGDLASLLNSVVERKCFEAESSGEPYELPHGFKEQLIKYTDVIIRAVVDYVIESAAVISQEAKDTRYHFEPEPRADQLPLSGK